MDLQDRAALYVVYSIPLLIINDGIFIIIGLWIHFAWCVDQRKKQYKRQEENLRRMRESGKYNLDAGKPYYPKPLPEGMVFKTREECFQEALEEAIKRLNELED